MKKQYPKAVPEDVADIVRNWTKYISQLPPGMTRVSLLGAKHSVGDNGQLVIVFSNYVTADHFIHDEGYRNRLRYFLRQCSGKDVEIEYKALDKGQKFTDNYVDLSDIVKMQAQRMQRQMEENKKALEEKEFTASAGGGAVEVVINGKKELKSLTISPDAVDPDDVEMLQDMIIAAMGEATKQVDAESEKLFGGMGGF